MNTPLLVCYTVDRALKVLKEIGVQDISLIDAGTFFGRGNDKRNSRVIGQRERNGSVELIIY